MEKDGDGEHGSKLGKMPNDWLPSHFFTVECGAAWPGTIISGQGLVRSSPAFQAGVRVPWRRELDAAGC